MDPSGNIGNSLCRTVGPFLGARPQLTIRVAEPDDRFIDSCGQEDEGIGHVAASFDGDQSDFLREFYVSHMHKCWTADEA